MRDGVATGSLVVDRLEAGHLESILAGDTMAICVRGFFTQTWCVELVRRFEAEVEASGRHAIDNIPGVRVRTLAITLEMAERFPADYLAPVAQDAPRVRRMFSGGIDPLDQLGRSLRSWGWSLSDAKLGDAPCHPDLIWALPPGSFSPVHVDTFLIHHPCDLSRFPKRVGYNIFLQTSSSGGIFKIHRREWAAGDHRYTVQAGKPATSRDVLGGSEKVEFSPSPGDMVLFDSHFYHEVTTIGGTCDRIAAHGTLLMDPARREACFCV